MKKYNKQTGGRGEVEARRLLEGKGFEVLEMNWGNKWGEVDLICLDGEMVVFAEVKAKIGDLYGAPWQMVNGRKLAQVRRMGGLFLLERGWGERSCRVDVVGVVFDRGGAVVKIDHWENVY